MVASAAEFAKSVDIEYACEYNFGPGSFPTELLGSRGRGSICSEHDEAMDALSGLSKIYIQ